MKVMNSANRIKELIGNLLPEELIINALYSIVHNDDAHNLPHIMGVVTFGKEICDKLELDTRTARMVLAGCLMHDLGCRYDRKTHHVISYGLAFEYLNKYGAGLFSPEDIFTVAESCLQHRGSWKEDRTHKVCELVAIADRGSWDKREYTKRSIQFHLKRTQDIEATRKEVLLHIPDKFGAKGYAWLKYPSLGFELFEKEIQDFITYAENPERINAVIDSVFVELKMYQ